jgi:tetratricopeptide (TPR) repeat protein
MLWISASYEVGTITAIGGFGDIREMKTIRFIFIASLVWSLSSPARAGLYYSGEQYAELPSQWRGFLLDQRTLRNIGIKPGLGRVTSPIRKRYEEAAAKLEKSSRERKLSADESADLGALYIRLGESGKAMEILRSAQREHPNHFHLAANLGTAWQLQGDLEQAAIHLEQAVRLAPGKLQKAEEYHLKLVRLRNRSLNSMKPSGGRQPLQSGGREPPEQSPGFDDLFGVRFVDDEGKYTPGRLAKTETRKLPSDAVAIVQQLALWLPADGRLLWQLAELANAHGDVKTAAAIMDGCVTEFAMSDPELRLHRQLTRAAADDLGKNKVSAGSAKSAHEGHAGSVRMRSSRPLMTKLDVSALPAIRDDAVNALPWSVLAETALDRKFEPAFAQYLRELDGKQISLDGYMQPLGQELEMGAFLLIEYPVGCWYCEMPEITGIVLVEPPPGKSTRYTRGPVQIEGTLKLNNSDPENFLYSISKARVKNLE